MSRGFQRISLGMTSTQFEQVQDVKAPVMRCWNTQRSQVERCTGKSNTVLIVKVQEIKSGGDAFGSPLPVPNGEFSRAGSAGVPRRPVTMPRRDFQRIEERVVGDPRNR